MGIESYDYTVYYVYNESCEVIGFKYKYLDYANYPNWVTENYSYVKNLQGDIVGIINDATGEQVVSYTYDAWGNITSTTGTLASTIGQYNSMRYRGYYYDTETGMYYLQSRYYNPEMRRFINADDPELLEFNSMFGILGSSLFVYCDNNAVNKFDSLGESAVKTLLDYISAAINGLIGIIEIIIKDAQKTLKSLMNSIKLLTKKQVRKAKDIKALLKQATKLKKTLKIIAYALIFISVVPMLVNAKFRTVAIIEAIVDVMVTFIAIGFSWIISKIAKFFGVIGWMVSALVDVIGEQMIRLYFTAKRVSNIAKKIEKTLGAKKFSTKQLFKAVVSALV